MQSRVKSIGPRFLNSQLSTYSLRSLHDIGLEARGDRQQIVFFPLGDLQLVQAADQGLDDEIPIASRYPEALDKVSRLCSPMPRCHTEFQPGYLFAALYSAGLLSVLVVPAFLCLEIVFFLLASHRHQKEAAKWYLSGAAVALLAETTFLIARTL